MKFKKFATYIIAAAALLSVGACRDEVDDTEDISGTPSFAFLDSDNLNITLPSTGTATTADPTGMNQLASGMVCQIEARGNWAIEPVIEEGQEAWSRLHPSTGTNEGIIRVFAYKNTETKPRTASYRLYINGVEQPQLITVTQDPVPPTFVLSANNVILKTEGGSGKVSVSANVDWDLEYDLTQNWLTVARDGNNVTFTASKANDTGEALTTIVYVVGKAPNESYRFPITVTQLSVLFSDDFSWLPEATPAGPPVSWASLTSNKRVDQWKSAYGTNNGWTGVADPVANKPYSYAWFNYVLMGSSQYAGNLCAPAISKIEGEINAVVRFSMAGFVSKKDVRADCNQFYVSILGPGRITKATAGGTSTAEIATGRFTVPYTSTGSGNQTDINLSELAYFTIGSNGYFDMQETTGLAVWEQPETKFTVRIEGMTNKTRVVILACEADKVNMVTQWASNAGSFIDSRKCFDNFSVEAAQD